MDKVLLIFIKNALKGKVKTRLAAATGDAAALHIYRQLLELTRKAATPGLFDRWLLYSDFLENEDEWDPLLFKKMVQHTGDLGGRMADAFAQAFGQGASRVLVIGSDCPYLDTPLLEQAFEALSGADVVIGPALDGGYYLLGMRRPLPELFENIDWSTDRVRAQTLERLRARQASYVELPTLSDIDTIEDWERFLQHTGNPNT